ncbi:hypothetical protein KP509_05G086000 [Ceratopteris richardii]|uniref:Uncharacterized protein n=1 Tax=Ceratopteris richardii TaxID=49495 RepID=A0A8T2UW92_CERRI|nr:hypothetical protein KP509_05G086000 [Ceratopteris richardii]
MSFHMGSSLVSSNTTTFPASFGSSTPIVDISTVQGFRKADPDRWEFSHEEFMRGQRHRLRSIQRRKSSTSGGSTPLNASRVGSTSTSGIVWKGGARQHIANNELSQLGREMSAIKMEVQRLRRHDQCAQEHIRHLSSYLQVLEMRQQQTVAFVARTICTPAVLFQYVNHAIATEGVIGRNTCTKEPSPQQQFPTEERDDPNNEHGRKRRCVSHPGRMTPETSAVIDDSTYEQQLQWQKQVRDDRHRQRQNREEYASSCEINQETVISKTTTSEEETATSYDCKPFVQLNVENESNSLCFDNMLESAGRDDQIRQKLGYGGHDTTTTPISTVSAPDNRAVDGDAGFEDMKMKQPVCEDCPSGSQAHEHFLAVDLNVQPLNSVPTNSLEFLPSAWVSGYDGGSESSTVPTKYSSTPYEDLESELFWDHLLGPVNMHADDQAR